MEGESQMRAFHSRKQEVYEAVSVVVQTLERIEDLLNQEVIGPSAWHETCSRLPVGYYSVTSLRLRDNEPVLARVARQRRDAFLLVTLSNYLIVKPNEDAWLTQQLQIANADKRHIQRAFKRSLGLLTIWGYGGNADYRPERDDVAYNDYYICVCREVEYTFVRQRVYKKGWGELKRSINRPVYRGKS